MKIYDQGNVIEENQIIAEQPNQQQDGVTVKRYDTSATSPFYQFKNKTTIDEARQNQEGRKKKMAMQATIHQKAKEQTTVKNE